MNGKRPDERRRGLRRRMDRDPSGEPLQQFDYRSSLYLRPNQKWVCGWTADGTPCQIGPDNKGRCVASYECKPLNKGGRWQCTRSEPGGGKCDMGPLPDGTCCRAIPRCRPVRSWRARRGVTARWVFVVIIGAVLSLGSSTGGSKFFSPGEVTFQHGEIEQCSGCHSAFDTGATTWLSAAFSDSAVAEDSKRCMSCHNLGVDGTNPHSLPPERLDTLKALSGQASAPGQPLSLRLASVTFDGPHNATGPLTCMTCHKEHHGKSFNLTAMAGQRCMTCHTAKFDAFSHGHPDFTTYPYERRTRLVFNHISHIGKHFRAEDLKDLAPAECKNCHMPDTDGRTMVVKAFDDVCAACHAGQIEGTDRMGAKGVAILTAPGLDVATLRERGVSIGGWPEDADGAITPFMDYLLAGDADYVDAKAALSGVDLLDLTEATEDQIAAVQALAWRIKGMLFDFTTEGIPGFKARLESATGDTIDGMALAHLVGSMPVDAIRMAQKDWFPELLRDVALHRSGEAVPMPGTGEEDLPDKAADTGDTAAPDATDDDSDILGDEDGDILGEDDDEIMAEDDDIMADDDDDDIFGDDSDIGDLDEDEEEDTDVAPDVEMVDAEDWTAAGGWYREEFSLRYRPMGHGDGFLRAWLDLSAQAGDRPGAGAARQIFNLLAAPNAPGACAKCHSIDARHNGGSVVNWRSKHPVSDQRGFTRFSHTAHFALLDEKGCLTCHGLDPEADYTAGFKDADPNTFASNFVPLERDICATCHTAAKAGDNCLTCHNYHIGTFAPVVASTHKMMEEME